MVSSLLANLENINKMMLFLQRDTNLLSDARNCFDVILSKFSNLSKYLDADADIIHTVDFTNAVIKIQKGQSSALTRREEAAVKSLKKTAVNVDSNELVCSSDDAFDIFVSDSNSKKRKISNNDYIDLDFIIPTSNCVERLFSMAKYVYSPHRQSMLPHNLEAILFLKVI